MIFKKEPAILITTHGPLCDGLLETMKMIYGEVNDVTAISLKQGEAITDYENKISEFFDKNDGNVVMLLDFIGGSPYNTAMKMSKDREICAVAGVNFGMLMNAMYLRSEFEDASELAAEIEKESLESLKNITPQLKEMHDTAKNMAKGG